MMWLFAMQLRPTVNLLRVLLYLRVVVVKPIRLRLKSPRLRTRRAQRQTVAPTKWEERPRLAAQGENSSGPFQPRARMDAQPKSALRASRRFKRPSVIKPPGRRCGCATRWLYRGCGQRCATRWLYRDRGQVATNAIRLCPLGHHDLSTFLWQRGSQSIVLGGVDQ